MVGRQFDADLASIETQLGGLRIERGAQSGTIVGRQAPIDTDRPIGVVRVTQIPGRPDVFEAVLTAWRGGADHRGAAAQGRDILL